MVIRRVRAVEFYQKTIAGRTTPGIIVAEASDGSDVELVLKPAGGCDRGVVGLACEIICAQLAYDLGIKVPEPFYVDMSSQWLNSLLDRAWVARAASGSLVAFGSRFIGGGYVDWLPPLTMSEQMTADVAAALAFDSAIENSDRRGGNVNCIRSGESFYVFDHELCFPQFLLGPKPWAPGGLRAFEAPGVQIFADALRRRNVDWAPVVERWKSLSDGMIDDYGRDLPMEWLGSGAVVTDARLQIRRARDNIEGLIEELRRFLA
jgi:hypothetical protein